MDTTSVLERHAVTVEGDLTAHRTIVFVHGFGTDQHSWDAVVPAFAEDHRVVRYDNAGAGRAAEAFVGHRYLNLTRYADDLLEICEALGVRDATVVGHSAGAMMALLAAATAPARIGRLVLVAASPRYLDDDAEGYCGGMTEVDLNAVYRSITLGYDSWADQFGPTAVGAPERPDLGARFAESIKAIPVERALTVLCSIFQSDHRAALGSVSLPTLLVQTHDDPFVPMEVAQYLHAHLAGSRLTMIDAPGHLPHVTAPDVVIEAIRSFL